MSLTVIRNTVEVLAEMQRIIDETNAKLKTAKDDDIEGIVAKCKGKIDPLAKEYKLAAEFEHYDTLAKTAIDSKQNAIILAVTTASYMVKVMVAEVDEATKKITKVELDDKPARIDLAGFDRVYIKNAKKSAAADARWTYAMQKLNQLFCLYQAEQIGVSKSFIEETYYLKEKAKEIELGKNPTSNSKLLGAVQDVVDMLAYSKNEKTGNNTYKATSHDVGYLKSVYARVSSKNELSVSVMNDRRFMDAIVRMMKRIATNGTYGVDGYKVIKKK